VTPVEQRRFDRIARERDEAMAELKMWRAADQTEEIARLKGRLDAAHAILHALKNQPQWALKDGRVDADLGRGWRASVTAHLDQNGNEIHSWSVFHETTGDFGQGFGSDHKTAKEAAVRYVQVEEEMRAAGKT
jgi:hypothetical protein